MRRLIVVLALAFLLPNTVSTFAEDGSRRPEPTGWAVNMSGPHPAAIIMRCSDERLVIDVRSPSGIGKMTLTKLQASPKEEAVVFRLHLKSLEGFSIQGAEDAIQIEAKRADVKRSIIEWRSRRESEDADQQPEFYAMAKPSITFRDSRGEPVDSIAKEGGFIDVECSAELLGRMAEPTLRIQWIDFYR